MLKPYALTARTFNWRGSKICSSFLIFTDEAKFTFPLAFSLLEGDGVGRQSLSLMQGLFSVLIKVMQSKEGLS